MGGKVRALSTYQSWQDMKQRCFNPRNHNFHNYGARGITVCKLWMTFQHFLVDMGERPKGLTLERINNNGNYEPKNCRWADRLEQRRNRRDCVHLEYAGKRMTVAEWGRELGRHQTTLRSRIRRGWPLELILDPRKFRAQRLHKEAR